MKIAPILFTLLSSAPADAPQASASVFHGKGLAVELVSEVSAMRPGEPFYAGIFIHHEGGSHTYWKNPGLAGVATRLEWSLPEGWTAGEIEWPAPDKVKMAAIDTHGFERDVLLMVRITPPAHSVSGVTLKTQAAWMCCSRTCHPGFTDLSLTLPAATGPDPAWHEKWHPVFEKERAALPVPLTGWKLTAVRRGRTVTLSGIRESKSVPIPENPMFFSSDNLICSHEPQKWQVTAEGIEAELTVSEFPPKSVTVLRGLLRAKSGWFGDSERAATVEVPLRLSE
jgi:DsbC/DsbD-like thiol-disulfide interchange protein